MQAQGCSFSTAWQKGTHSPFRHSPLSKHTVLSGAFSGAGQSLLVPTNTNSQHKLETLSEVFYRVRCNKVRLCLISDPERLQREFGLNSSTT